MRLLVTGGLGYLGSALLSKLKNCPEFELIKVLDSPGKGDFRALRNLNDSRFRFVEGNVNNPYDLAYALDGIEHVVHLSFFSDTPLSISQVESTSSTMQLVRESAKENVSSFTLVGTISSHGPRDERGNVDFSISEYPLLSQKLEQDVLSFSNDEFKVQVVRFGTLYGESAITHFDSFANRMALFAGLKRQILIFGEGTQRRATSFVGDAAQELINQLKLEEGMDSLDVFNEVVTPLEITKMLHAVDSEIQINFTDQDVRTRYDILPMDENQIKHESKIESELSSILRTYGMW